LFDTINSLVSRGGLKFSTTPTLTLTDEPQTGGKQDDEKVLEPSGYEAGNAEPMVEKTVTTTDFLSPSEKSLVDSALSSNKAQVSTGPQDVDTTTTEPTHLTHDAKRATTDGIIEGDGEQVKGTDSQDMADSSLKTSGPFARSLRDISDDLMLTMFPHLRKVSEEEERAEAASGSIEISAVPADEHKEGGDFTNVDGSEGEEVNDTTTTAIDTDEGSSSLYPEGNA
jgi:hypothetical protein